MAAAVSVEQGSPRYCPVYEERTVSRNGIELNSLFYNSSALSHLRRSPDFAGKVKVKYDPTDLGHIRVYDPIKKTWLGVPALDFDYADKLSLWQHRVIRRFSEKEYGKTDMVSLAMTKKAINEIVHEETEKLKKTATSAKVARWKKVGLDAEETSPKPVAPPAPNYSDGPLSFSEEPSPEETDLLPDLAAQLEQMEADDIDLSGSTPTKTYRKGGN
jgi:putative transposase